MKIGKKIALKLASSLVYNSNGLIPVAVTDSSSGMLLMLAYADKEAVLRTLRTGFACFYSRSRKSQWMKGETSGNTMAVQNVLVDCDKDSLQYAVDVNGKGLACHLGRKSCFADAGAGKSDGNGQVSFGELYSIINKRIASNDKKSYTLRLATNDALARAKIMEEAEELVEALRSGKRKEIVWEACDVFYHALAACAAKGITLGEFERELARRHRVKGK